MSERWIMAEVFRRRCRITDRQEEEKDEMRRTCGTQLMSPVAVIGIPVEVITIGIIILIVLTIAIVIALVATSIINVVIIIIVIVVVIITIGFPLSRLQLLLLMPRHDSRVSGAKHAGGVCSVRRERRSLDRASPPGPSARGESIALVAKPSHDDGSCKVQRRHESVRVACVQVRAFVERCEQRGLGAMAGSLRRRSGTCTRRSGRRDACWGH